LSRPFFFHKAESEEGLVSALYKTIDYAIHADMSCTWKTPNLGGDAKYKNVFYHCYHIKRDDCELPKRKYCDRCTERHAGKQNNHPDWKCFHHDFDDPASVEEYEREG
jgi:hypothetical protein